MMIQSIKYNLWIYIKDFVYKIIIEYRHTEFLNPVMRSSPIFKSGPIQEARYHWLEGEKTSVVLESKKAANSLQSTLVEISNHPFYYLIKLYYYGPRKE